MPRSVIVLILAALTLFSASPAASQRVADSIRSLDSAWARAYATNDTVLADRLFADDIIIVGGNGALKTKAQEMADVRPVAGGSVEYFRTNRVELRVHPTAAIVTGVAEWVFVSNGQRAQNRRRYSATYVRGGPLGWRMVALQLGRAPEG